MITKTQNQFWDSYSTKYDRFIDRYASSTYKEIIRSICNEIDKTDCVLEIGTGTGIIAFKVASKVESVIATDISQNMIKIANNKLLHSKHENLSFKLGNAYSIDFPDKQFNVVIASNVFHLLTEPEKALNEIYRVLTITGKLIIPTYCHGENTKTKIISSIMGISGFQVANKWSTLHFRNFIESSNFKIISEEIIRDRIPMSIIVAVKHETHE